MENKNKSPIITLMIVTRNEKEYLRRSLSSLLLQSYPKELTEIIIVDGMSTDGTREWLNEKITELRKNGVDIKLLDNPKYILASGWNIGIKNAKGDIVCRIDAHSEIYPDYVEKGIKELIKRKEENVVCVGGILENIGFGEIGEAIANLYSSKFGVGNSVFRTGAKEPVYTDTAVFGLYWKWIFDEVGYFNESLKRNQDIDLHSKILEKGYKFITHPGMKAKYYVRGNIKELIKKAFGDGYWIAYSEKSYLRHRIPMYFVLYLLSILPVSYLLRFFKDNLLLSPYLSPLVLYFILLVYFSLKNGKSLRNKSLLLFLFPIFHISYGLGSVKGFLDKMFYNKRGRVRTDK